MHQTKGATPPRHHGSIRRPVPSQPDLPHLITTTLSDTSSSTSSKSPSRNRRASDAKILRGAQIIRQHLQHHVQDFSHDQPRNSVSQFSFVNKEFPGVELTRSISSDEFSDPWTSANLENDRPPPLTLARGSDSRLGTKSRPWNRDLIKSSKALVQHPESVRGKKLHTLCTTKTESSNVLESPTVADQDDSLAWEIDTPPAQSLESFSFPEHGDASQWAEMSHAHAPSVEYPPPLVSPPNLNTLENLTSQLTPPNLDTPENSSSSARYPTIAIVTTNKAEALADSISCTSGSEDVDLVDKRIGSTHNPDRLGRVMSNELSSCSGSSSVEVEENVSQHFESVELHVVTPPSQIPRHSAKTRDALSCNIVSPLSTEYRSLLRDDAYCHAMSAGYLWQSLVGQHVRFPRTWWKGARSPPMGMDEPCRWMYLARHRVQSHPSFNKLIRRRNSPGRLLLHIILRDLVTWKPVQDIVIGCFHTNARGVRNTEQPIPTHEECREVWMAIRKRCDDVSVVDCLLTEGDKMETCARESPLMGSRHHVTNVNVRVIFGEEPPKRTVFILESELYERLVVAADQATRRPPALILLQEFFSDPDDP